MRSEWNVTDTNRKARFYTIRAREIQALRTPCTPEIARHLAAVGHRADRRHVHRQVDGRGTGVVCAVRQRRAL